MTVTATVGVLDAFLPGAWALATMRLTKPGKRRRPLKCSSRLTSVDMYTRTTASLSIRVVTIVPRALMLISTWTGIMSFKSWLHQSLRTRPVPFALGLPWPQEWLAVGTFSVYLVSSAICILKTKDSSLLSAPARRSVHCVSTPSTPQRHGLYAGTLGKSANRPGRVGMSFFAW